MRRLSRWWLRRRLDIARYWQARGDLEEAARHAGRALRLAARVGPTRAYAMAALTVAEIGRDRVDYASSRARLEEVVARLEVEPSTRANDWLLVRALTCLGDICRRAGWYHEAAMALDRARHMLEREDPPDPSGLAAVLMVLGIAAKERGATDQAATHYAEVGELHERLGAPAAAKATLQHNLAGLAYARQRYALAESHARRAVALRSQTRKTTVDLAADVAVLAAAVAARGRHNEARDHLHRALEVCRAARPPRKYEIAVQLHLLATIDQASGQWDDAERHYRQALSIKEQLLGPDHPDIAVVCNNIGTLLHERRRPREAAIWYRRALTIAERAHRTGHPLAGEIRANLRRLESGGARGRAGRGR
jgi:tetratricopeptide (TPR) repeat protein